MPKEQIRTEYAIDTAVMNSVGVFGPLAATSVALNFSPEMALRICATLIFIGGAALSLSPQLRSWEPEKKTSKDLVVWRTPAMQLLMLEGVFIGLGWGAFDIAVPAFTTLENIPHRSGILFAIMAAGNVIGGLVAGMVSKKLHLLQPSSGSIFFGLFFHYPWPLLIQISQ